MFQPFPTIYFLVNMLVFAGATLPNQFSEYPMVKLPMVSSVTKTPIPGKCNPRWIDRTSVVWHSQDVLFVSWSVQIKRPRILDPDNYNISEFLERTARQIIFKATSETGAFLGSTVQLSHEITPFNWPMVPPKKILHFLVLDRLSTRDMNIFNGWFHVL